MDVVKRLSSPAVCSSPPPFSSGTVPRIPPKLRSCRAEEPWSARFQPSLQRVSRPPRPDPASPQVAGCVGVQRLSVPRRVRPRRRESGDRLDGRLTSPAPVRSSRSAAPASRSSYWAPLPSLADPGKPRRKIAVRGAAFPGACPLFGKASPESRRRGRAARQASGAPEVASAAAWHASCSLWSDCTGAPLSSGPPPPSPHIHFP